MNHQLLTKSESCVFQSGWETGIENTSNSEGNNMQSVGTRQKTL
jgi:hypothetical protein